MTYLDLEKNKPALDSDDDRSLVFLQTIILVTLLHELTHTLMNKIFSGHLDSFFKSGDILRDIVEHERSLFVGSVLCVEWLQFEAAGEQDSKYMFAASSNWGRASQCFGGGPENDAGFYRPERNL
ncbi:uncharacterized protein EV420DRAFT_1648882 [Desarmillaria tabescens]|uniref:Uncharacterized protein n=1 Tax=Armillaria tabescens TaxID=1929756 RepID=A0AA39JPI1_ARMTA|nr:uncharacterized protein EV420DRAFT_1648882 [Desarmillaria tabescens]KAK0444193.1 hypothetical protein EV420DRAFT_1648882 [Desarmillaria tabescens]